MFFNEEKPKINNKFISTYSDSSSYFLFLNKEYNNTNPEVINFINSFSFLLKSVNSWKNNKVAAKKNIKLLATLYSQLFINLSKYSNEGNFKLFENSSLKTNNGIKIWVYPQNSITLNEKFEIIEDITDAKICLINAQQEFTNIDWFDIGKIINLVPNFKIKIIGKTKSAVFDYFLQDNNYFEKIEDFYKKVI